MIELIDAYTDGTKLTDTAENEYSNSRRRTVPADEAAASLTTRPREVDPTRIGASVGKISAKCCSFSAVSAPIFARKYAFCSILRVAPTYGLMS